MGELKTLNFVNRYDKVEYKIVLSKFDIFKPVYSLVSANVYKGEPENKFYYVQTINLERQGWNNWKVVDYRNNEVRDLSFQDTVNLASRYDLTTSFPGKENYKITNYPPLSQSEIESNRQNRERDEVKNNFSYYKTQVVLADEEKYKGDKEKGIAQYKQLLIIQQQALKSLNNNQQYTYPDNSTIEPNPANINYIKNSINAIAEEVPFDQRLQIR